MASAKPGRVAIIIFPVHMSLVANAELIDKYGKSRESGNGRAAIKGPDIYIVEDEAYFTRHKCHKAKLVLHRASMRYHYDKLMAKYGRVHYVAYKESGAIYEKLAEQYNEIVYYDPVDHELTKRLSRHFGKKATRVSSPLFLCSDDDLAQYHERAGGVLRHDSFYKWQRRQLGVLMNKNGTPKGGKWSYDTENRHAYPRKGTTGFTKLCQEQFSITSLGQKCAKDEYVAKAKTYVNKHFPHNYGQCDFVAIYYRPDWAKEALRDFVKNRAKLFGPYQDALSPNMPIGFHSYISHALNIGLILPGEVIDAITSPKIPIASAEGFLRQVIGWREYVRYVYVYYGPKMRKSNYWQHTRQLSKYWWDRHPLNLPRDSGHNEIGEASSEEVILPLDLTLEKVWYYGYAHHIERLMVIGSIMFMLSVDPNDVYDWFMTCCAIDAYDWVMVPNIYGMSQSADAKPKMMTRPYLSSANYINKMSAGHYAKKGSAWEDRWNAIYHDFLERQEGKIKSSPGNYVMMNMLRAHKRQSAQKTKALEAILPHVLGKLINLKK